MFKKEWLSSEHSRPGQGSHWKRNASTLDQTPLPQYLKETVLLSPYLAVSVHEYFLKSVIKDIGNFPQIFPPNPGFEQIACGQGKREGGLKLKPAYYYYLQ